MNHFTVTTPDGVTHERITNQPHTHAVIVDYGEAWGVVLWTTSEKLAERERAQRLRRKPFELADVRIVAVEAVPA